MPRFAITDADSAAKAVQAAFEQGRRVGQLDTERAVVRRVDAAVTRGDVTSEAVRAVLLGTEGDAHTEAEAEFDRHSIDPHE